MVAGVGVGEAGKVGAGGDDLGGVHFAVDDVVVLFDLREVGGVAEAGGLEQLAEVAVDVGHFGDLVAVGFEVAMVDSVETDEGGVGADVGLRDVFTHDEAAVG